MLFALPFPLIDPVLVRLGPLQVHWYGIAYIAGLVAGWALMRRVLARAAWWGGRPRPDPAIVDDLLVYCAIGVIVGGRLGNALFYDPAPYLADPLKIFRTWEGGMAFHGGLIGAILAIALFAWRRRVPTLVLLDLAALVAPIGLGLGRLANFVNGELWGRPTDVPWAVVFPGAGALPRHPSQLYEAGLEGLALFAILWMAARLGGLARPGRLAGLFGVGYGLTRIFAELYRDPDPHLEDLGHGLTMGMVLSAPLIIIGAGLILLSFRRQGQETR